jgi:hypothetical protein
VHQRGPGCLLSPRVWARATGNGREVRGGIASKVTWPASVGGRSVSRVHERARGLTWELSEAQEGRYVRWSGQRDREGVGSLRCSISVSGQGVVACVG